MSEHRYILEKYKDMQTRYVCPACKVTNKTFTLYIDTETGKHLNPNVGKCNRESKCGYHYTPKQYFEDNKHLLSSSPIVNYDKIRQPTSAPVQKQISFIPVDLFKASLKNLEANHFVKFLISTIGVDVATQLISRYFIATSKLWDGATVFWQIDRNGKVRTGKIMLYDAGTGKRVKKPYSYINWVHKVIQQPEYELKQCLFGEHLLIDKTKPIAIVESEKTAVIASAYLPQFIWLAVGSLTNLTTDKCSVLKGRSVTLFPDLNGFKKWSNKAKELSHITTFNVSDLLERKASEAERGQGLDLADYLIRFDYKEFAHVDNLSKLDISKNENLVKPSIKNAEVLANVSISNNQDLLKPVISENGKMLRFAKVSESENLRKLEIINFETADKTQPFNPIITDNNGQETESNMLTFVNLFSPVKEDWSVKIAEIENYFETHPPLKVVRFNASSTITDVHTFIASHIKIVKANNGKKTFLPYLERLEQLKEITQTYTKVV